MPSAIATSKKITKIILSASDDLTASAKAEQNKIFAQVFRWINKGGKFELDLDKDGNIRKSGKNFTTINNMAKELGRKTSLNRIKKSVTDFGRATHNINEANRAYATTEFDDAFKNAARFSVPGKTIRDKIAQNLRPEPYLDAFQQPIKDVVTEFTRTGRNFFDLVEQLQNNIAGVRSRDPDGVFYQRGLLENYYQAKRITRDAMFGASRAENAMIGEAVGATWRQYIGGIIEDSRNECIRRVNLEFFTKKEVDSWTRLPATVWPEKIQGVDPEEQCGGYNCLHDIRPVSERRVPVTRVTDSYRDGYLKKAEATDILGRKGFDLVGAKANPSAVPKKKEEPIPTVEREPEAEVPIPEATKDKIEGGRGTALKIKKANLAKELQVEGETLGRAGNNRLEELFVAEGLAAEFKNHTGTNASFANYEVEGMNTVVGTLRSLKTQYGYATEYTAANGRKQRFKFGGVSERSSGAAHAAGTLFGIKRSQVNGGYKSLHKTTGEDHRKAYEDHTEAIRAKIRTAKRLKDSIKDDLRTEDSKRNRDALAVATAQEGYYESVLNQHLKTKPYKQWILTGHPVVKGKELEAVVIHEFGHVMHDQTIGGLNGEGGRASALAIPKETAQKMNKQWKALYRKYLKEGEWIRENLSEYGASDDQEFFAESFVLYNIAPELVPNDIKVAFTTYWAVMDKARKTRIVTK